MAKRKRINGQTIIYNTPGTDPGFQIRGGGLKKN
jgi:hypothetical protein